MMAERSRKGLRQEVSRDSTAKPCRLFPPLLPSSLAFGKFQHFDALWDYWVCFLNTFPPLPTLPPSAYTPSRAPLWRCAQGAGRELGDSPMVGTGV